MGNLVVLIGVDSTDNKRQGFGSVFSWTLSLLSLNSPVTYSQQMVCIMISATLVRFHQNKAPAHFIKTSLGKGR